VRIILVNNAKDLDGFLLPLCFFGGNTRLLEEKEKTCIIQCDDAVIEVLKEYIVKP
jgi:hypothetical protein